MIRRLHNIVLLCSLIGWSNFSADGQSINQDKIDSLKILLDCKKGIDRWEPLVDMANEYYDSQMEQESVNVLQLANELAYKYRDTVKIVETGRLLGRSFNRLARIEEASKLLVQLIPLAEHTIDKDRKLMLIYNPLGNSYMHQALFDKALYYHFKSLAIREALGDKLDISIALNNIGLVYYRLKNFDKAIEYYLRALRLKKQIVDSHDLDRLLINLSLCYQSIKKYDIAQKYLDSAFSVCKSNCSIPILIEGEYARGQIYYGRKLYVQAGECFLKSYRHAMQTDDIRFQLDNLVVLSDLSLKKHDLAIAGRYLKTAEGLAGVSKFRNIELDIWHHYAKYYEYMNDFENSTRYNIKYIQLRDSLFSIELTQKLLVIQNEYEQKDNKAKIAAQNEELLLKGEAIRRQKILTAVAVVAIVILGLLIFVLYRYNQHKKSINIVLEQKVIERTRELDASYRLVENAYNAQNHFITEALNSFSNVLFVIRDLGTLGEVKEKSDDGGEYINQINKATVQLSEMVNKLKNDIEV